MRIRRVIVPGAHPDGPHLVGREDLAAVRGEIEPGERVPIDHEGPLLLAGPVAATAVPARWRAEGDDLAGARGARQLGHRSERMPEGHDAGLVQDVVDPGPARLRQADATLAAVPRDRDQRRDMPDPPEQLGVRVGALPRHGHGNQARVAGSGLDGVAVPSAIARCELQGARRLHRAPPHVDRFVEDARDDGHRMDTQVPSDRRMIEPRR
jgi:hypothetical protein